MPTEVGRKTARKVIKLPGGGTVSVPVITEISFIAERGQETQYTVDNRSTGNRAVRVDVLGSNFNVERIITWRLFDPTDRAQESQVTFDNLTGHDSVPPHFSAHLKTHVVRYRNDPDDGSYIDSELIDQFAMFDVGDRAQETIFTLNQPQTDEAAQADPNDPDISDPSTNAIDPPWRTDPFQNLIEVSESSDTFLTVNIDFGFAYYLPFENYGSNPDFCTGPLPPPGVGIIGGHMVGLSLKTRLPTFTAGWTSSGLPTPGRSEPFELGDDDLGGGANVDFPPYAQIDKEEGTGFPLDLSTGEAMLFPDYSSVLQFSIKWWDATINTSPLYQVCGGPVGSASGGLYGGVTGIVYEAPAVDFDLSGATITNDSNPSAGPIVYHAIGTRNSSVPADADPYFNMTNPPPYNMKITHVLPAGSGKYYYNVWDIPFFGGAVERMYSIPTTAIIDDSLPFPGYVDDLNAGCYLRITVLFKKEEPT